LIPVPFKYQSGDEIKKGGRLMLHGEPGEIEFVAEQFVGDSAIDWYVQELGGVVMVIEPKVFGRVFLAETENQEDLVLVARA
jgi:hypothetical protein